jgi:hypothetical protein
MVAGKPSVRIAAWMRVLNRLKQVLIRHKLGQTGGSFLRAPVKGGGTDITQNASNGAIARSQQHIRALQGMSVSNQARNL